MDGDKNDNKAKDGNRNNGTITTSDDISNKGKDYDVWDGSDKSSSNVASSFNASYLTNDGT